MKDIKFFLNRRSFIIAPYTFQAPTLSETEKLEDFKGKNTNETLIHICVSLLKDKAQKEDLINNIKQMDVSNLTDFVKEIYAGLGLGGAKVEA